MTPEHLEQLPTIIWAAHALHGDVFVRSLDHLFARNEPASRERLHGHVARIVAAAPPPAEVHEFRALLPDGAVAVVAAMRERDR